MGRRTEHEDQQRVRCSRLLNCSSGCLSVLVHHGKVHEACSYGESSESLPIVALGGGRSVSQRLPDHVSEFERKVTLFCFTHCFTLLRQVDPFCRVQHLGW